jgi:hypothetical protein
MCPKRDWFTIYASIVDNSIFMVNDLAYKIVSINKLKIRMHDKIIRGNYPFLP